MSRRGRRRAAALTVGALVLFAAGGVARGDDAPALTAPVHVLSPSTITTDGGSTKRLPPGWFYDEAQRAALDAEIRRAQDSETRLRAENLSLRESADEPRLSWRFVVGAMGLALIGGLAAGAALL